MNYGQPVLNQILRSISPVSPDVNEIEDDFLGR